MFSVKRGRRDGLLWVAVVILSLVVLSRYVFAKDEVKDFPDQLNICNVLLAEEIDKITLLELDVLGPYDYGYCTGPCEDAYYQRVELARQDMYLSWNQSLFEWAYIAQGFMETYCFCLNLGQKAEELCYYNGGPLDPSCVLVADFRYQICMLQSGWNSIPDVEAHQFFLLTLLHGFADEVIDTFIEEEMAAQEEFNGCCL